MDIKKLLIIIIIIFILYYFDNTYEGFSIGNVFCNSCADPPEYCPPGNIPCPDDHLCDCSKGACVSTCPTNPPPPKPLPKPLPKPKPKQKQCIKINKSCGTIINTYNCCPGLKCVFPLSPFAPPESGTCQKE